MNKYHYIFPKIIQSLFFVFFLPVYKFFIRFEVHGKENITDLDGPIIIASNHTSELDPTVIPLITDFFSKILPVYSVIYPIEKYKDSGFGWRRHIYKELFFEVLGGYPTYSGFKDYERSLENHINLLNQNKTVCIFPEGKCTLNGKIQPARGGLGFLAHRTNALVVPLAIDTLYNLSFYEFISRKRKVTLRVLKPMKVNELLKSKEPTVEEFREIGNLILNKINSVLSV
ncbi:MAG: lysophospholipid acyltransferase family protein [Minisyncoccia bacterium]